MPNIFFLNRFLFTRNLMLKKVEFTKKSLSWYFMDAFFFFLARLCRYRSRDICLIHSIFCRCMSLHIASQNNSNLKGSATYRLKLNKHYWRHVFLARMRKRFYSDYSSSYAPVVRYVSNIKFSNIKNMDLKKKKRRFFRNLFFIKPMDRRKLIFDYFSRNLLLNSNMSSIYGNGILFFSLTHDNLFYKLSNHGSSFLSKILYKPISFFFY